jgi:hypothetical protein
MCMGFEKSQIRFGKSSALESRFIYDVLVGNNKDYLGSYMQNAPWIIRWNPTTVSQDPWHRDWIPTSQPGHSRTLYMICARRESDRTNGRLPAADAKNEDFESELAGSNPAQKSEQWIFIDTASITSSISQIGFTDKARAMNAGATQSRGQSERLTPCFGLDFSTLSADLHRAIHMESEMWVNFRDEHSVWRKMSFVVDSFQRHWKSCDWWWLHGGERHDLSQRVMSDTELSI